MRKLYYSLFAAACIAGSAIAVGTSGTRAADDYTVVGSYELTIRPTDVLGSKAEAPVTISVEVRSSNDDYCIAETGSTNYFEGRTVPFKYNSNTKYATFDQTYVEEVSGAEYSEYPYLWVAAFAYNGSMIEPQPTFAVKFDATTGFEFPADNEEGIAWYLSDSATEFNPYDAYSAFYIFGQTDNGGNDGENYGDSSIEGEWTFTLDGHYLGNYSLGQFDETFNVSLDGNTVTFESTGSQYNIVAEFTAENTLTFNKVLVGSAASAYGLWQVPYVNTTGIDDIEDLTEQVFTATYNPAAGTITFPANSGLAYGYFDNSTGALSYMDDAFDFVSASKAGAGNFADASIEGEWSFTLDGHYLGNYSLGQFDETFNASLEGNTVTFESTGSQYNIKAEFTAENTLTFNKVLVGSAESAYGLWQVPYVNTTGIDDVEDLTEQVFTATYNPAAGTITFPANSGLAYGYFDNSTGVLSYMDDAFDFVSASKGSVPQYGDSSIEGEWTFSLDGHYLGSYSLGKFDEKFEASLNGNTVTFESTGSQYNIVAEFTAENTLTFNKVLVGSSESAFGLWQIPYVNTTGIDDVEDLTEQVFTATYDPAAGTITFPANSGLAYGYFNNATGALSYMDDAFDFVSASKEAAPNYGDSSIEGEWNFTLDGHYLGEYSIGKFEEKFEATLSGNIVTFASSGSQYNIVAEFTAENTLTFNKCAVGAPATYTLYQSPYVNTDDTNDLETLVEESFTAIYDPATSTITFPEGSGLRYGYFDAAGQLSYWDDAFDFVKAGKDNGETPEYGDSSIEGNWVFTLNGHYLGEESLGVFTETFEASLEGNIVTFASTGSPFDIVAEFTSENTLKFNKCAVGAPATYTLYQSPYINGGNATEIGDLPMVSFTATYDADAGTITFPENSGLAYGYFDAAGEISYWADAYDFVTAEKGANEILGTYTWTIQPTDITGSRTAEPVEIEVEVRMAGGTYAIYELGNTNYFNDQVITFSYNDNTNFAQFTANYAGMFDGKPTWFSPFVYNEGTAGSDPFIEVQENYGVAFNAETGFVFTGFSGFAWFETETAEDFNSTGVYSAFYILPSDFSGVEAIKPAAQDGETIYFDLQGRRVINPQGGIFIKKTGNTVQKVVINK